MAGANPFEWNYADWPSLGGISNKFAFTSTFSRLRVSNSIHRQNEDVEARKQTRARAGVSKGNGAGLAVTIN